MPNTIGMMCSVIDDKLVLDQFYGPTANRIAGRFTLAGQQFEDLCHDITAFEENANPEVIFFDISYNAEIDIDDVNRRKQIYRYQLSLLNFDHSHDPLTLDDLYITIRGKEMHLVSKRLHKRLIPRLSTAYNYSRSDLSVFRFLCDLQMEGLKRNFDSTFSTYFPGQNFYPRLEYYDIIVSPAIWRVKYADIRFENSKQPEEKHLLNYLIGLGIERYVLTRTDDRTLCFDIMNGDDLNQLLFMLRKFKEFMLEEGFIAKNPTVKDNNNRPFNSEFFVTLFHDHEIFKPSTYSFPYVSKSSNLPERFYPPGSEWLYFEIFVHPFRSDLVLQEKIAKFLKLEAIKISHWFFIRYEDSGAHLRLRIKVKSDKYIQSMLFTMSSLLQGYIQDGIISDYLLRTYVRELERYGKELIDDTEKHFTQDSKYVLSVIKYMFSTMDKYSLCLNLLLCFRQSEILTFEEFDHLTDQINQSFSTEHRLISSDFKTLNKQFKHFKEHKQAKLPGSTKRLLASFEASLKSLVWCCAREKRSILFADLIHMHINRLFAEHQRSHEMIIYYFLQKEVMSLSRRLIKTKMTTAS